MMKLMKPLAMAVAVSATSDTVKLNNGVEMPVVSLGTAGYNDDKVVDVMATAVGAGFKAVDTAFNYYNQKGVGNGLKKVGRDKLFVTSKTTPCIHPSSPPVYNIQNTTQCQAQTRKDIDSDLQQLDVDHIDLLLIHGANHHGDGSCGALACELNVAQWKVYEEYVAKGKVRAIGVSNYCPSCLDCLLKSAKIVPAVNQVRYHPGMTADPEGIMSYSMKHGIIPMAYSPMGSGSVFTDPLLTKIGAAHNKSAAQVSLKWIADKGYVLATKTSSEQHLKEDLDLFAWELTKSESSSIDTYAKGSDVPSWACTAGVRQQWTAMV